MQSITLVCSNNCAPGENYGGQRELTLHVAVHDPPLTTRELQKRDSPNSCASNANPHLNQGINEHSCARFNLLSCALAVWLCVNENGKIYKRSVAPLLFALHSWVLEWSEFPPCLHRWLIECTVLISVHSARVNDGEKKPPDHGANN